MPKRTGPAPQPNLRLLQPKASTARRSPTPAQRPPTPPAWLNTVQRSIWKRTVAELIAADIGALAIDQDILTAYVCAVANMETAAQLLAKEGPIVKGVNAQAVRNPAAILFGQSARLVDSLAGSLGLSPDARSRMKLPLPDTEAAHVRDLYA